MNKHKIAIILFITFFCFVAKAQNRATDSLEIKVLEYLKTSNDDLTKNPFLFARFYSCPSNYIVCIEGFKDKPCREKITKDGIYKIVSLEEGKTLYFENSFFKNVTIDDKDTSFFSNSNECIAEKKTNLTSPDVIMLLINRRFSILNKVKGKQTPDSIQNLLCPDDAESIYRVKMRKRYGNKK